jgi:GAF domain-containing protein
MPRWHEDADNVLLVRVRRQTLLELFGRLEPLDVTREERLSETFIGLADTLVQDFEQLDLLYILCERSVEVLEMAAGGVLVADDSGELCLAAASDERMRLLEVFEAESEEGPCLEAYREAEQVVEPYLETAAERWPRFAPRALKAGFRSGFGFPLKLRGHCIGAFNLLRAEPGLLDERDARAAQALADAAAISILQARVLGEARAEVRQLQHAVDRRVTIEQAKGIIAAKLALDLGQAFDRLRRYARNRNLFVRDVAEQVINGSLAPETLKRSSS